MSTHTLTQAVADHFKANPGVWISMQTLAQIGGLGGWRTRVSNARTEFGMHIENRVARVKLANGEKITRSDYRFVPSSLLELAS